MQTTTTHRPQVSLPPEQSPPPPAPWAEVSSHAKPPRKHRWKILFFRLFAATVVVVSLVMDWSSLLIVPLLFVLVVPFEKLFPRHDQPLRRDKLGLDITYALSQPVAGVVTLVLGGIVGTLILAWLPGLAVRPLVVQMSPLAQMLVGFVIFDLIIYWVHRWAHEVPFLWRFHSIHHSIETMDWVSAFRNHPFDGLIIAPAVAFMVGAGFSLEVTGILTLIQIATGIFLHANVRWRWKPLQRLVITPDFHHWHHANETDAINSNYSVFLPAWDIIFGSWYMPPDRRPSVYGVDESVPAAMAQQMAYPFRGLQNPIWMLRHPIRGTKHLALGLGRGVKQMWRSCRRTRRPVRTPGYSSHE